MIKHGTCYGKNQQDYFSDALNLMRAVNSSPVRDLFAKNIGGKTDGGPDPRAPSTTLSGWEQAIACACPASSTRRAAGG